MADENKHSYLFEEGGPEGSKKSAESILWQAIANAEGVLFKTKDIEKTSELLAYETELKEARRNLELKIEELKEAKIPLLSDLKVEVDRVTGELNALIAAIDTLNVQRKKDIPKMSDLEAMQHSLSDQLGSIEKGIQKSINDQISKIRSEIQTSFNYEHQYLKNAFSAAGLADPDAAQATPPEKTTTPTKVDPRHTSYVVPGASVSASVVKPRTAPEPSKAAPEVRVERGPEGGAEKAKPAAETQTAQAAPAPAAHAHATASAATAHAEEGHGGHGHAKKETFKTVAKYTGLIAGGAAVGSFFWPIGTIAGPIVVPISYFVMNKLGAFKGGGDSHDAHH